MANRSSFSIHFDVEQVEGLADKLSRLPAEEIGRSIVDAINETVDSAYVLGRKTILSGVNLTDDYVQRKMQVQHATVQKPKAEIVAFGGRSYLTSLSHYGAMQLVKDVNWSNERIIAAGHKFGPWPGWTKRKGNEAVGIAVNKKADGRSVEVVKGSRKRIGPAFAIPGKTDNEGNPLVFRRKKGSGKLETLTGPSVYQLFKVAAVRIEDQVAEDLQHAVAEAAEEAFNKGLS